MSVDDVLALFRTSFAGRGDTVEDRRNGYDSVLEQLPIPPGVEISEFHSGSVDGYWVNATGERPTRTGVLLHGGGYVIGSARGYRPCAAYVSRATRSRVLVPDYRLAPENPYPAGIEDALVAIDAAIDATGPGSTFVIGDSAGGGLALSTMLAAGEAGRPAPACAVLVSALVDLRAANGSFDRFADTDQFGSRAGVQRIAETYLAGCVPDETTWAFPMDADLGSVPPTLVMVGAKEVLLDDSRNLVAKLADTGVAYRYAEYADATHAWTLFPSLMAEAREALAEIGAFIDAYVLGAPSGQSAEDLRRWLGV
jgi:epsilon-lactone hydrolase